jgi:DNA-binding transcriptional MerR regulator
MLGVSQRKLEYWLNKIGDVERINHRRIYSKDDIERIKTGIGRAREIGLNNNYLLFK